jgi:hypothetical protein
MIEAAAAVTTKTVVEGTAKTAVEGMEGTPVCK